MSLKEIYENQRTESNSLTEQLSKYERVTADQSQLISRLEMELKLEKRKAERQEQKTEDSQTVLETEVEFWKEETQKEKARAESFLKELTGLEQETRKLKADSSVMTSTLTEWEDKYNLLLERLRISEQNNEVLTKKLTILETNSIAYERELSKLETAAGRGSAGQSSQTTAQDLLARIRNQ